MSSAVRLGRAIARPLEKQPRPRQRWTHVPPVWQDVPALRRVAGMWNLKKTINLLKFGSSCWKLLPKHGQAFSIYWLVLVKKSEHFFNFRTIFLTTLIKVARYKETCKFSFVHRLVFSFCSHLKVPQLNFECNQLLSFFHPSILTKFLNLTQLLIQFNPSRWISRNWFFL